MHFAGVGGADLYREDNPPPEWSTLLLLPLCLSELLSL